jgi:hypothetical protein
MGFKDFFKEFELNEAKGEFNAGDAMEGIFALAVALYVADGKIDKNKLNSFRKDVVIKPKTPYTRVIDSDIAQDGYIANALPQIKPGNKIKVVVSIQLKQSAKKAFGPGTQFPIPDVDYTIDQMTTQIENTSFIKKVEKFIIKVLTNNKPENVTFYVVADGVGNSAKQELIKGDVTLRVEAKVNNTTIPIDAEKPIHFSIKTEDSKEANLSLFTGCLRLGKIFELPLVKGLEHLNNFPQVTGSAASKVYNMIELNFREESKNPNHLMYYVLKYMRAHDTYSNKISDEDEAKAKVEEAAWSVISACINALEEQIKNKKDITNNAFNFLEQELFGSDLADVIKLHSKGIDEITKENIDYLRTKYKVAYTTVGKLMRFDGIHNDTFKSDALYSLMPEVSISKDESQNRVRFLMRVGSLIYKFAATNN